MKLAFSTLGCPAWSAAQVADTARRLGFNGVELRGFNGRMDTEAMPEFTSELPQTRALFADAGLAICCLSTSATLATADRAQRREQIEHTRRAIEIAAALACPYVRVFGGRIPAGVSRTDCADDIAQALAALGGVAHRSGVTVLLETHDDFSTGKHAADVIDRVEGPGVGILWDILHPYRCGEAMNDTVNYLGSHIRHVHIKDAINISPEGFQPVLLGEGVTPVAEAVTLLRKMDYHGFLSLEWEKAWRPEIPGPEIAFPQYIRRMRQILTDTGAASSDE